MFSIRDPINVALDKLSLQRNDKWNGVNEYWWNVVNSHNAANLRKKRTIVSAVSRAPIIAGNTMGGYQTQALHQIHRNLD